MTSPAVDSDASRQPGHGGQMRPCTTTRVAALAVAVLLLAGCGGDEVTGGDPVATPTPDVVEQTTAPEEEPDDDATADTTATADRIVIDVDFEERSHGSLVRVSRFTVTDRAILVDVEIVVSAEQAFIQLNNVQQGNPAMILDDLGNTYPLIPVEGNDELDLDGGEVLDGTLSFEGPVDAEARTLQLVFNPSSETDGPRFNDQWHPHFTFPPVDLAEGAAGESSGSGVTPTVVDVELEQVGVDGTRARVTRVEVTDVEILVDIDITVAAEREVVWFSNTLNDNQAVVTDDLGNTYELIPPSDNYFLEVEGGEQLEGTLVFQGPLRPGASAVQLLLNRNSEPGSTNPTHLRAPHFTFPPVDVSG
jgi:hypothetical protein